MLYKSCISAPAAEPPCAWLGRGGSGAPSMLCKHKVLELGIRLEARGNAVSPGCWLAWESKNRSRKEERKEE